MSDHTVVLTVVLDKDYRVDDAESIMFAIRMIKGVLSVKANVTDIATQRTHKQDMIQKRNFGLRYILNEQ